MRCQDCLYFREDEDGIVRCYFPLNSGARPCDPYDLPAKRTTKGEQMKNYDEWGDRRSRKWHR